MARYELREGTSSKFWEIVLEGTSFTTSYGKIGTDGQSSLKEWDSEERAQKEYDKLVAEKVKKGYARVSGEDEAPAPAAPPSPASPPLPTAAAPAPVVTVAAPAPVSAPAPAPAPASASSSEDAGARYFEFVDGKSSKFWEIVLEGNAFTTRYGRIGTDGQQSLKEYDSEAKARAELEKLVAEKVKKGYVEK